jgi:transcriptional regulator of arginine metabolism
MTRPNLEATVTPWDPEARPLVPAPLARLASAPFVMRDLSIPAAPTKAERQRLIASVVSRRRIGSQLELAEALARAGCTVTQATISRDIRELRLEKTSDALGRPRYVVPGRGAQSDPRESLNGVLHQFGLRATAAQNIVVVQSELGSAPAIARALDRLDHPKIVGTLAGDDTCLVIASGPRDARAVARELAAAIG